MTALGPCQGSRHADARRECGRQATVIRQGRALCESCDAQHRAGRNARQSAKRATQREHAHANGQQCDRALAEQPCAVCDARRPGRRPLVLGEETSELRVRVPSSLLAALDRLVARGYAADRSAATRLAIEEADARRG